MLGHDVTESPGDGPVGGEHGKQGEGGAEQLRPGADAGGPADHGQLGHAYLGVGCGQTAPGNDEDEQGVYRETDLDGTADFDGVTVKTFHRLGDAEECHEGHHRHAEKGQDSHGALARVEHAAVQVEQGGDGEHRHNGDDSVHRHGLGHA